MTERAAVEHDHAFIAGERRCLFCHMDINDVRREMETRMLTEAFNRLASVLEKLEAKLADSPAIPLVPGRSKT